MPPSPDAAIRTHAAIHWATQAWHLQVKTVIPDCQLHVPKAHACTPPARRLSCCGGVRNPCPCVFKTPRILSPIRVWKGPARRPGVAWRPINPLAICQIPPCPMLRCALCVPCFVWRLPIVLHPLARWRMNHERLLEALIPLVVRLRWRTGWRLRHGRWRSWGTLWNLCGRWPRR